MSSRKDNTPYFPEFQAFFRGRPNISQNELRKRAIKKIKISGFDGLKQLVSTIIPGSMLKTNSERDFSRNRIYNLEVTFFGFLNEVILNTSSCALIVKKIQSWRISNGLEAPSSATGGYVKAKKKLDLSFLKNIFNHTATSLLKRESKDHRWLKRTVKVVDGSGLSMPDTKKNQKAYPQNGAMKKGCGFPQLNMTALFSLGSGALLGYEIGNKHNNENRLWKRLWQKLDPFDIVLGDRGFCSYVNIASLLMKNVDSVLRLRGSITKKRFSLISKVSFNDFLYKMSKSQVQSSVLTKKQWKKLPAEITVRIVKIKFARQGFRTQEITVITTLLDHRIYTPEKLAELYMKRWSIELYLRDIKTTMGMEILKSKTPTQVRKEICMFAIAYNLIRSMIMSASVQTGTELWLISFSGAVQQTDQWLHLFIDPNLTLKQFREIHYKFHIALAQKLLPERPGRNEPRAKKRRPKNYNLMNKPRRKMRITNHRNRPEKKNAFF